MLREMNVAHKTIELARSRLDELPLCTAPDQRARVVQKHLRNITPKA
jgi:hypothetical protein